MSEDLFDLPPTPPDKLAAARARYDAALRALAEIKADGGDDTGCATEAAQRATDAARRALAAVERERYGY